MTPLDHILIAILFVVQPVVGRYNYVAELKRIAAGEHSDRVRLYWQTIGVEWLFLTILFAVWIDASRSFELLGFVPPSGAGFWLSTSVVTVSVLLLFLAGNRVSELSQAERDEQRASFGNLGHFLPQSNQELRVFYQLSVTAGIVEEIVFRGFMLWYLQHFMGIWPAVAVSSLAFGLAHSYQGLAGIVRTGLAGAVLGVLFAISGSIWLPIAAHILVDVTQGRQLREIYRDVPEPASTH
jgi:membrane protease YdiL (CAAX protease family)